MKRRVFLSTVTAAHVGLASCLGENDETLPEPPESSAGEGSNGTLTPDPEYDIIEAAGQVIRIEDNDVFENTLVDLSTGADFTIDARNATNWTIRNIGFTGYYEGEGMIIGVSDDSGGTSTVENIYLGDGASKSGDDFVHGPGAIFLGPEHTGHIEFSECNVQGYPNNGFYCSNGTGTCRWERCYAGNNGVSSYRTNTEDEIVECVGFNDTTSYGWYHDNHDYVEQNGRPVWVWGRGA